MDKWGGCKPAHIEWKVASKSAGAIKVLWLYRLGRNLQVRIWSKVLYSHWQLSEGKIGKKFAECVIFKITNNWLKVNYYDILLLYSFSIKIKKKSFWGYYKGIAKK